MRTKDDIRDAILRECDVCVHLHGKIPDGGLDYRPSGDQRSMLELLRYLSFCGIGGTYTAIDNSWDRYKELSAQAENLAAEDFPSAMERQKDAISACFDALSEDQLDRETALPTGEKVTVGRALYEMPLRWLNGYRMQLFLYAKAAGNSEIWTPNCWMGIDWEKPVQA